MFFPIVLRSYCRTKIIKVTGAAMKMLLANENNCQCCCCRGPATHLCANTGRGLRNNSVSGDNLNFFFFLNSSRFSAIPKTFWEKLASELPIKSKWKTIPKETAMATVKHLQFREAGESGVNLFVLYYGKPCDVFWTYMWLKQWRKSEVLWGSQLFSNWRVNSRRATRHWHAASCFRSSKLSVKPNH